MMKFVLLIFLWNGSGYTVTPTYGFLTREACVGAANDLLTHYPLFAKATEGQPQNYIYCAAMGVF